MHETSLEQNCKHVSHVVHRPVSQQASMQTSCPAEPSCNYVNWSSRVPNVQIVNGVDSLFDHAECLETMSQICVRQRLAAFSCCSLSAIIRSCQGDLKKISSLVSLPCICCSASFYAIYILCRCSLDQRYLTYSISSSASKQALVEYTLYSSNVIGL